MGGEKEVGRGAGGGGGRGRIGGLRAGATESWLVRSWI